MIILHAISGTEKHDRHVGKFKRSGLSPDDSCFYRERNLTPWTSIGKYAGGIEQSLRGRAKELIYGLFQSCHETSRFSVISDAPFAGVRRKESNHDRSSKGSG
jgi:hypothetical protein